MRMTSSGQSWHLKVEDGAQMVFATGEEAKACSSLGRAGCAAASHEACVKCERQSHQPN